MYMNDDYKWGDGNLVIFPTSQDDDFCINPLEAERNFVILPSQVVECENSDICAKSSRNTVFVMEYVSHVFGRHSIKKHLFNSENEASDFRHYLIKYLFTTMSTNEDFEYTCSREDDVYTLTYHDGWGHSEFKIYKLELETPCSEYTLSFEQRLRMDNEYNDDPEKGLSVEYYESDCLNF